MNGQLVSSRAAKDMTDIKLNKKQKQPLGNDFKKWLFASWDSVMDELPRELSWRMRKLLSDTIASLAQRNHSCQVGKMVIEITFMQWKLSRQSLPNPHWIGIGEENRPVRFVHQCDWEEILPLLQLLPSVRGTGTDLLVDRAIHKKASPMRTNSCSLFDGKMVMLTALLSSQLLCSKPKVQTGTPWLGQDHWPL